MDAKKELVAVEREENDSETDINTENDSVEEEEEEEDGEEEEEEEEENSFAAQFHRKGGSTYCPPYYEVLMDEDDPRFVKSFYLHQTEEFKEVPLLKLFFFGCKRSVLSILHTLHSHSQFFRQFGFVVIRDVLSKEECDATEVDVWEYLESMCWVHPTLQLLFPEMANKYRINRHNPHTWQNEGWAPMKEEGILGGPLALSKPAFNNRQNPNVYKVRRERREREGSVVFMITEELIGNGTGICRAL